MCILFLLSKYQSRNIFYPSKAILSYYIVVYCHTSPRVLTWVIDKTCFLNSDLF